MALQLQNETCEKLLSHPQVSLDGGGCQEPEEARVLLQ